ncbi:MAG: hypothetical protein GY714_04705 [Desulfobacterales bacterium]|nr:hypothetical protein [Desulfobacterales bacterium]
MKKAKYLLVVLLLLLASTLYGKGQAPIDINYDVFESRAVVTLTFNADADNVNINISSVDNIDISTSKVVINDESFNKDDTREFDVEFTKKQGKSYIAIFVTGKFNGIKMYKIINIQIGKRTNSTKIEMMKQLKTNKKGKKVIIYDLKK